MRSTHVCAAVCLLCLPARPAPAQEKKPSGKAPRQVQLTRRRSYRLEAERVQPGASVKIVKSWVFGKAVPKGLVDAVARHPRASRLKGKSGKSGSIVITWQPPKKKGPRAGAMLWLVDGPKTKFVYVEVVFAWDRTGAKQAPPRDLAFDDLKLHVDVENTNVTDVRWAEHKLPDKSRKASQISVSTAVEVAVVGMLTAKSSRQLRAADELSSGTLMQELRRLGWTDLQNDSHYGITLGWLGHEKLRHRLAVIPGKPGEPIAFRYQVSGEGVPLKLVRRQFADAGWPMVLSGTQYVGSSSNGVVVVQPVELILSRRPTRRGKEKSATP